MRPARAGAGAAALLCAALLSGCVVASPDDDTYRDASVSTLGTAASEVATVETLVTLLEDGRIPRPAVVAQLRYSEKSLGSTSQGFTTHNPPSGAHDLEHEVGDLLDEAEGTVADTRIAVHAEATSDYARLAQDLADLARRIEDLEKELS